MVPVWLNQTPARSVMRRQFRLAVAIHILERRRLTSDAVEYEMFFPKSRLASRILISERRVQMDAAQHQNIRPAIAVEVMDIAEH